MSTSPISLGSIPDQTQGRGRAQQIMQDFKQLASALQSGDLAGSQQAYSALQQLLPNQAQNGQQSTSGSNPIGSDFKALGQALQSGDLNSAQSAFSQLQTDLKSTGSSNLAGALTQAVRGHHGHHHHASSTADSDSGSTSSATGATDSSGSSGQLVNVVA
jgi:hypothetical protein